MTYLKANIVLLITFVLTAFLLVTLYGIVILLLPQDLYVFGIAFDAAFACLFSVACLKSFANRFLYDKIDRAGLQLLGGVRIGDAWQAMWSGKTASWPFARLSATRKKIRLQTVFGNYAWERADPCLIVRKRGLWQWKIGAEHTEVAGPIVFFALPWQAKMAERKLKELGYEVRPWTFFDRSAS